MQQVQTGADSRSPRSIRTRTRTAPEVRPEGRQGTNAESPQETHTEAQQESPAEVRREYAPEEREEPRPEVLPEVIYDHTREELFSRYQDVLDESRETGATIHIWQDGVEELVVMSPETFRRYALMELETLLAAADEDEREGRFSPLDEVFARLEEDMRNGTL